MAGGPSHLETFDYKPKLTEMTGKPMPDSFTKGQPIAQLQGKELRCLGPTYKFAKHGKNGQEVSELFPHIAGIADDICIVRSMQTEAINHDPAHTFMNTGSLISGRPSMGSWLWYGIGAEAENLPGFVVLTSTGGSGSSSRSRSGSGIAASCHRSFRASTSAPRAMPSITSTIRRRHRNRYARDSSTPSKKLNRIRQDSTDDPEIATRISQYEMALRCRPACRI
jgi:hypothetical protein